MADDTSLAQKWGVAPAHDDASYDPSKRDDRRFIETVIEVAAFETERAATLGSEITIVPWELGTNLVREGFGLVLARPGWWDLGANGGVSTYGIYGADTLLTNYEGVKPWLHECVTAAILKAIKEHKLLGDTNEKGQVVGSLDVAPREGIYANGGCYALAKDQFAKDLNVLGVGPIKVVEPTLAFYFTTVYFNAGRGGGHALLKKSIVNGKLTRPMWHGSPKMKNRGRYEQYNAALRASTYERTEELWASAMTKLAKIRAANPEWELPPPPK